MVTKVNNAIDKALTRVEMAAINRWHISALLLLGIGLLLGGNSQKFELIGGNYTNIISATVSLLVLAEQKRSEKRQAKRHAEVMQSKENSDG